jgi:heptosyltransferase III
LKVEQLQYLGDTIHDGRICIFRIGSMGDTVVALPCFHAIRRAFGSAHITLLTNFPISAKAAPMLAVLGSDSGFVDDVLNYTIGLSNPLEALRLVMRLRARRSSTLVYMRSGPTPKMLLRDKIFFRLAGFRRILCMPTSKDQRLPRINPHTDEVEPEASRLARCFATLEAIDLVDPANWDLLLNDGERSEGNRLAERLPHPFLAINTGGKEASKDWGFNRWATFLKHFQNRSNLRGLAIVGAEADQQRAQALLQVWGDGAVNFCAGPSPRVVAALLSHAHLFVGHDSGPLHLAQCVGTPALGLYGSHNRPKEWHPLGFHVHVIHDLRGMAAIRVECVLEQALALMGQHT